MKQIYFSYMSGLEVLPIQEYEQLYSERLTEGQIAVGGIYTVMMRFNEREASKHALSQPASVDFVHLYDNGATMVEYSQLDEDFKKVEGGSVFILVKDGSFKYGYGGEKVPKFSLTYPRKKVHVSAKEGYFIQSSDPIDAGYKILLSSVDINDRQLISV